jgi:hypothetical protein
LQGGPVDQRADQERGGQGRVGRGIEIAGVDGERERGGKPVGDHGDVPVRAGAGATGAPGLLHQRDGDRCDRREGELVGEPAQLTVQSGPHRDGRSGEERQLGGVQHVAITMLGGDTRRNLQWLPRVLTTSKPASSNARTIRLPDTTGS